MDVWVCIAFAIATFFLGSALTYLKLNAYCRRVEGRSCRVEIENARLKRGNP